MENEDQKLFHFMNSESFNFIMRKFKEYPSLAREFLDFAEKDDEIDLITFFSEMDINWRSYEDAEVSKLAIRIAENVRKCFFYN